MNKKRHPVIFNDPTWKRAEAQARRLGVSASAYIHNLIKKDLMVAEAPWMGGRFFPIPINESIFNEICQFPREIVELIQGMMKDLLVHAIDEREKILQETAQGTTDDNTPPG
jgi:hypothetical protein